MATRRKSIRDLFEQMQRLIRPVDPKSADRHRIERWNRRVERIANRYRNNINNAIDRENKNTPVEDRLDRKFDKEIYTRATAAGSNT